MLIREIQVGQNKFEYPVFLFEYLHSYLFRFAIAHNLYTGQSTLYIPSELLPNAKSVVANSLRDLFKKLYQEPSHEKRSKYGSRYKKIRFDEKVWVVNFRTDPLGNTAYGIYVLLNWIESRIEDVGVSEEE